MIPTAQFQATRQALPDLPPLQRTPINRQELPYRSTGVCHGKGLEAKPLGENLRQDRGLGTQLRRLGPSIDATGSGVLDPYCGTGTVSDSWVLPVLQLAKPSGDEYPFAEERRLFYVALTRARRGITILTLQHRHSPFLVELTKTMRLEVTNLDGEPGRTTPCPDPKCNGSLVPRKGKYGMFLGCTNYPTCQKKAKIANQ